MSLAAVDRGQVVVLGPSSELGNSSMKLIRNTLAFPFYFVAFVLHLLCAAFTIVAQKIAGDESGPSHIVDIAAIVLISFAGVTAMPIYVLTRPDPDSNAQKAQLVPQAPLAHWRSIPTGFLPEQNVWARPLVRLNACIFAERAVRNALQPAMVEFAPCGDGGKNHADLDDDYYEASVRGIATVNGKERAFTVTLNHYPPATSEWGFIATGIEIEREHPTHQIACAEPNH